SSTTTSWVWSPLSRTSMVRSTDSRRARNSASVMMGRRRPASRPSFRRCRLASRRVEPLSEVTSSRSLLRERERRRRRRRDPPSLSSSSPLSSECESSDLPLSDLPLSELPLSELPLSDLPFVCCESESELCFEPRLFDREPRREERERPPEEL